MVVFKHAISKYTTLVEFGDTVHQSVNVVEIDDIVPFSEHRFNFGAFYLRFDKFEDPATGKIYTNRKPEELFTFTATAPTVDSETGEVVRIELDVHKCTIEEDKNAHWRDDMDRYRTDDDK